jgi:hypothetical protein
MTKFVLVHYGFETPTPEIMEAWKNWFASVGDNMVDAVGGFGPGKEITPDGIKELPRDREAITGFTVIQAGSMDEAVKIAKLNPMITSVRVYEAKSM